MSAMLALAYPIKEGVERLLRRTGPWVPGSDVPHSRKVDAQTIAFEVVGHCKLSLLEESPTSTNRSSRCPKHPRQERACLGSLQWGTDSLGLSARRHLIAFNRVHSRSLARPGRPQPTKLAAVGNLEDSPSCRRRLTVSTIS